MRQAIRFVLLTVTLIGCSDSSSIDVDGLVCKTRLDCGKGFVCDPANKRCVKGYDGINGVTATEIVLGNSGGTVSGGNEASAKGGLDGAKAYLEHVNSQGGIFGRKFKMEHLDDGLKNDRATANVAEFTNPVNGSRKVFALLANYGSGPVVASVQTAIDNKTIFFAPVTGSAALRKVPPDRYVFNYRASGLEQVTLAVRFLTAKGGEMNIHPRNIAVFAQGKDAPAPNSCGAEECAWTDKCSWNAEGAISCDSANSGIEHIDAYGEAGFTGTWQQLKEDFAIPRDEVVFATYPISTTVVKAAAVHLLRWLARPKKADEYKSSGKFDAGIILQALNGPAAAFVALMEDEIEHVNKSEAVTLGLKTEEVAELKKLDKLTYLGTALSEAFAKTQLEKANPARYCENVMAVQLVPEPNSSGSLVLQYREHLKAYDANLTVGPYTLEGYIGARILLTAIEKNGPDITTESLVETLESMDKIDVGLGVPLGLSQEDHQACHAVWLRKLDTVCKFVDFTQITR